MKGIKKIVFIANLILFLAFYNWMIAQKEYTIRTGELVLLQLYPQDPRSIMQGDYMTLRYEMTRQWGYENLPSRGYCIVKRDNNKIAKFVRLQTGLTPVSEDELAIKYYRSDYHVKIGAESFFFEEGQQKAYDEAAYGGLKVEPNGSAVLVGLYDEAGKKLINNYDM